jgi:hypothetical protein
LDIDASAGADGEEGRERARHHARRLVEAGATVLHEMDEPIGWCIVMTDPEGNEFCVNRAAERLRIRSHHSPCGISSR